MVWVVANKARNTFLTFDDDDKMVITRKYTDSTAFDDSSEAIANANELAKKFRMSPLSPNYDDMLFAQLR
ncbi:hypothetical protein [uncultured Amphritea sp.]|uniref:hypothetical protein n=1 Tax=uncultured Amphritea sp. TaxID=981605 RepID=UPI00261CA964|nr:hypothetical protein [uncultured Amphritea sp.]